MMHLVLGVWITQQKRKSFNCEKCEKIFSNEKDLTIHLREHMKEVHVCQICEKSFLTDELFHSHKEEHCIVVDDCKTCGENFNNPDQLVKHKEKHCMAQQIGRNQCDKSFNDDDDLNEHVKTHTQEKEFKCSKCDKIYGEMSKLRRHDWRSHRNIDCNICGELLESREQISEHRKIVHKMSKKIKCKFFPDCLDDDECFFVHEETSSQELEGNQNCKEGENCKNQSCEYTEREHKNFKNIMCRFQSKCNKPECRFKHVIERASFLGFCSQNCKGK